MSDYTHEKYIIEVLQAFMDGKTIQIAELYSDKWEDLKIKNPRWNWRDMKYRVKVEPREWWVNIYPESDSFAHISKEEADRFGRKTRKECVHVREVIE
jgi:hypothetical protein